MPSSFDPNAFLAPLPSTDSGAALFDPEAFMADPPEEPGFASRLATGAARSLTSLVPGYQQAAVSVAADASEIGGAQYASDTLNTLMSGAARSGESAGFMLEKFGGILPTVSMGRKAQSLLAELGMADPDAPDPFAASARAFRDMSKSSSESWMDNVSAEYQRKANASWDSDDFGATTLVAALAGSLPEMAATMGTSAVAGKAIALASKVG